MEESRVFAHRAAVEQAVQFCDLAIGLSERQRSRLTELFLQETRPTPKQESSGLSLQFTMILQTATLSREKLKPIFEERQWHVVSALLKQLEEGAKAAGAQAVAQGRLGELIIEDVVGGEAERPDPPPDPQNE